MAANKIFYDLEFVFQFENSTSYKVKKRWKDLVTDHGGIVSYIITQKVSVK